MPAARPKRKHKPLLRYWKVAISRLTGLNYCDRECGCGDNNQLWWFPCDPGSRHGVPQWVPGWMNGADTDSIWSWLVENDRDVPSTEAEGERPETSHD
jgi:hypothetical protein